MSFELIYKEIGDIGRYQIFVLFLGWMSLVYGGFVWINSVFLLYVPDHRCAIPVYANDTFEVQGEFHQRLINETIPLNSEGEYENCYLYVNVGHNLTPKTESCTSWVYDKSLFTETLGAKLNLVCDRTILKSTAQMIFFSGVLIGSFLSGIISDRFGRRPTLCTAHIFYTAVALSIAWTPSIEVYMVLRGFLGCIATGTFLPEYVMAMEFVGPSKRLYAGQIGQLFSTTGNLIMAGLSYWLREWSTFQIICASPGVLFLSYWILCPESPRWLYFKGRRKELKTLLMKAASINRRKISDNFFETLPEPEEKERHVGFHKLFSHRTLAVRTCVLYVNWIAVCMASYGLALNSDGIGKGSGLHLYFALQMLMDVPAIIINLVLADRVGRKRLMIVAMLIGGLACIGTIFTTLYGGKVAYPSTIVLALTGRLGAQVGFLLAYQYSAELFPTVLRNSGMGSCSCMARIGGILAPLVADLDRLVGGKIGKSLPLIVFGALSVFAGLLLFILPETAGRELPGTIQDGIEFGKAKQSQAREDVIVMQTLHNKCASNHDDGETITADSNGYI